MALPSKGIRKISVGDISYYWTVKQDYQAMRLVVGIGLVSSPNQHVSFFCRFEDLWLAFPDEVDNEIRAITPSVIRSAIHYAENQNSIIWNGKKESIFRYRNKGFMLVE